MELRQTIDINCDLGEGMPNDAELMPYISSCNIACGGHYGTKETIRTTIRLAVQHGVKVGAHPSYPDKGNFGRKSMNISAAELSTSVREQLTDFISVCQEEGIHPNHIKLHGALYNDCAKDDSLAKVIIEVLSVLQLSLPIYTPFNSALSRIASRSISEAFVDRRYNEDGSLVARSVENAVILSPADAWNQLSEMYFQQQVSTINGNEIPMKAETFCLHGDTENALEIAEFIDLKLKSSNIRLDRKLKRPVVRKYGSGAILMEWEAEISPKVHEEVVRTANFLSEHHQDWILEIVTSYHSLVIFVKENIELEKHIHKCQYLNVPINENFENTSIWQVPVCYDASFGYDLESISKTTNLSTDEIVGLHSEAQYRIYGMGFLPGFLYLGGLNEKIHSPRKSVVNQLVPKGSVAIGGKQTGIYPQKSPGGWNVIGRTPIDLFNPELETPSPFSVGDSIQFIPVNLEEFNKIESEVTEGKYELKLVSND